MSELFPYSGATAFAIEFLFYLLLTAHIALFVDLSKLQKHPTCKLNYLLSSSISAFVPCLVVRNVHFATALLKHSTGITIAIVLSIVLTLVIQQIIKVDIDF